MKINTPSSMIDLFRLKFNVFPFQDQRYYKQDNNSYVVNKDALKQTVVKKTRDYFDVETKTSLVLPK